MTLESFKLLTGWVNPIIQALFDLPESTAVKRENCLTQSYEGFILQLE